MLYRVTTVPQLLFLEKVRGYHRKLQEYLDVAAFGHNLDIVNYYVFERAYTRYELVEGLLSTGPTPSSFP